MDAAKYGRVPVEEQIEVFRKKFYAGLDGEKILRFGSELIATAIMPYVGDKPMAEDWFVIPKPSAIGNSVVEATELLLGRMGIGRDYTTDIHAIKRSERTQKSLDHFTRFQLGGDFWVIPAQLGHFREGESVQDSRNKYYNNEFGLDAYLVAACLFTHRGRLTGEPGQLGINCLGNDDLNGRGEPKVPCFNNSPTTSKVRCQMSRVAEINPRYGSATGFEVVLAF